LTVSCVVTSDAVHLKRANCPPIGGRERDETRNRRKNRGPGAKKGGKIITVKEARFKASTRAILFIRKRKSSGTKGQGGGGQNSMGKSSGKERVSPAWQEGSCQNGGNEEGGGSTEERYNVRATIRSGGRIPME